MKKYFNRQCFESVIVQIVWWDFPSLSSFLQFIDIDGWLAFVLLWLRQFWSECWLIWIMNGIIDFKMVLMFHGGIGTVLWRAKVLPFNVPANHRNCMEGKQNFDYWWDFGTILVAMLMQKSTQTNCDWITAGTEIKTDRARKITKNHSAHCLLNCELTFRC